MDQQLAKSQATQRIVKVRRDYNRLVSDETLEDYALRFTPRSFRKWGMFRVANTAFGAVSFLALEAIGASITMAYGFTNAVWAILVVAVVIFLTGLPIAYRAARHGLDMDLLARGAGFGYLGSTITSLIYAGFTFIFFALEAAIMAQAFDLWFDMPRSIGYLLSALIVIPLVTHGITTISRLQLWTQPLWLVLLVLPFVAVAIKHPETFHAFTTFNGLGRDSENFSWAAFGGAATVAASLIAQIGEQVDFLRFMPEPGKGQKLRWWLAVIVAGPGWIVLGAAKMLGGAFLAFLALQQEVPLARALEPMQMYWIGFKEVVGNNGGAIFLAGVFVIISQIKINVTNAYAGSLAWSNFFARLTHSHPGRVVWLVFNVLISVLLMMRVFEAINQVLGLYAHLAVAWVGSVVANLVISQPLGLSPKTIEFRRAYLYDINPAGFGAMLIASATGVAAHCGLLGQTLQPASVGIALGVALIASPFISWIERKHYAIAREPVDFGPHHRVMHCSICRNKFEAEDIAYCPAYQGPICSLCCTLDARCGDRCKKGSRVHEQFLELLSGWLPHQISTTMALRVGQYVMILSGMICTFGVMMWLLYAQILLRPEDAAASSPATLFWKISAGLVLLSAVAAWWLVLTSESRHVAQEESDRQNLLLQSEIDAHRQTDAALQRAKEEAERANFAKSRFLTGMSHEMRSPLNCIIGYSQLLLRKNKGIPNEHRDSVNTIYRSGEHLASLVDGLLELSRIEAGKLRLEQDVVNLREFIDEIVKMFAPQARKSGLQLNYEITGALPLRVHADPKRLRQIFINLLSNAIKFTECGSVSLRVRYQREIAHIEIEDTGVGIAAADHERVFMPFERASAGKSSVEGTGLGLTITQLLVELMGGDIRLRSRRGEGSCFMVRLYLPALPNVVAEASAVPVTGYAGMRRKVLIVDDDSAHRGLLRALLQPIGFLIEEADCGAASLKIAARVRPDLILLDIGLPDMTGWQVGAQLHRERVVGPAIIMVSANAHENTEEACQEGRCDGFVTKPVDEADLLDKVRRALDLQWLRGDADNWQSAEPDPEILRELLALAAGGFPQALRARFGELAEESPELLPWVGHCLGLIDTDMSSLTHLIFQTLQDHATA